MSATRGPGYSWVKVSVPPMRAPHVVMVGVWGWTRTARGSEGRSGHPYGERYRPDKAKLGRCFTRRRFIGRRSLLFKRHWLPEKRPTNVGRSPDAPSATSPVAPSAGSWKA